MILVKKTHPMLKTVMKEFDFTIDAYGVKKTLSQIMRKESGIGLSANQIGLPYRMFVLSGDPEDMEFINPRVVDESKETITLEEGCLTFPGMWVKVKRPKTIKVRYQTCDGQTHTRKFDGITARAFLHELDHLNGITFKERANKYHWEQAEKKRV